jgi:hypothetical protein
LRLSSRNRRSASSIVVERLCLVLERRFGHAFRIAVGKTQAGAQIVTIW